MAERDEESLPEDLPDDPQESLRPDRIDPSTKEMAPQPLMPDVPQGSLAHWSLGSFDDHPESSEESPQQPNTYLFKDLVGRGGFGEVWHAVQVSLGRSVAVKRLREDIFISTLLDDEKARFYEVSFRQEALTTAHLDHPNIVPIHDLGLDEDGRPLLAMKLVKGSPWHRMIADDFPTLQVADFLAKHLPILVNVAQAVAFAHSRGVIHRDLKPSQVMVGEFGEVYLMDWGLAVVYDEDRLRESVTREFPVSTPTLATASNPAGTAAFMAPEQTEKTAANIGPWTDVYLLGGMLFFLLCGYPPHHSDTSRKTFLKAKAGLLSEPTHFAPKRAMPRELVQLAMNSMAPERELRLGSAREFLGKLQDYLSGTSRRRESVALVREATDRLTANDTGYEKYTDALGLLTRAAALWPDNSAIAAVRREALEGLAHEAVAKGDLSLARLQAERIDEEEPRGRVLEVVESAERLRHRRELQRRAALAAAMLLVVAVGVAAFLMMMERSGRMLAQERELQERRTADLLAKVNDLRRRELRLAEELAKDLPLPGNLDDEWGKTGFLLDEQRALRLLGERGALRDLRTELEAVGVEDLDPEPFELLLAEANLNFYRAQSMDEFEGVMELYLAASARRPDLPEPLVGGGIAAWRADYNTSATELLERAVFLTEQTAGVESEDYARATSLAGMAYGALDRNSGRSREFFERALDVLQPLWIRNTLNLAEQYEALGEYSRGVEFATPTLTLVVERFGPDAVETANVYNSVATHLMRVGRDKEALHHLEEAARIYHSSEDPPLNAIGSINLNMGHIYTQLGDYAEGEQHIRKAIEAWESSFGEESTYVALAYNNLGTHLMNRGRYSEAIPPLEKSADIYRRVMGEENAEFARSLENVGAALSRVGRIDEAEEYFKRTLEIKIKTLGPDHPNVGTAYANLGAMALHRNDAAKAAEYMTRSMEIYERTYGETYAPIYAIYNNLAVVHRRLGELDRAEELYRKSLKVISENWGTEHPEYAATLQRLGYHLTVTNQAERALPVLKESLDIYAKQIEADPESLYWRSEYADTLSTYADAQYAMGDLEEALASIDRAISTVDPEAFPDEEQRAEILARSSNHVERGKILYVLGRKEEARATGEAALRDMEILEEGEGNARFRMNKGKALMLIGRADEGIALFQTARGEINDISSIEGLAKAMGIELPPAPTPVVESE